jgi:hypothetical protein
MKPKVTYRKGCLLSILFWIGLVGCIGFALFLDGWGYGVVFLSSLLAACGMAMTYVAGYFTGRGEDD